MKENEIYLELKTLLEKCGMDVREDSLENGKCGSFTLKGKRTVLLNKSQTLSERITYMVGLLDEKDLASVSMKPALRKLIGEKEWE
jgi:hypothetical protein